MSKRRRPTIPVSQWRIATELEETKKIQGQHGTPAFQCDCAECSRWHNSWQEVLPDSLSSQLKRFGIDPAQPTDIYGGDTPRVSYHVVGKILSGPDSFLTDGEWGKYQKYHTIRKEPAIGISVARDIETSAANPEYEDNESGDLIVIDLRLKYPNAI